MKKYNLSAIMKRAWEIKKENTANIFGICLKMAWAEAKEEKEIVAENVIVEHYYSYNARRYSLPWVCVMKENGTYDFSKRIGCFTAKTGEEGDLIVFHPVVDQVYGYGQKDYRGGNTVKAFIKWNGKQFVACDKLGR